MDIWWLVYDQDSAARLYHISLAVVICVNDTPPPPQEKVNLSMPLFMPSIRNVLEHSSGVYSWESL